MEVMLYEERQRFALWVYVVVIGAVAGAIVAFGLAALGASEGGPARWLWLVVAAHVAVGAFVSNILLVTTRVTNAEVYVRLGWLFPMIWKRIPLEDVIESRCVAYRPLRDAGGWGMRFGRFEGRSCRFYNARGHEGVLIETPKRLYIIGSQSPERLEAERTLGLGEHVEAPALLGQGGGVAGDPKGLDG